MARTSKCNVLMVFPRFNPKSFWSFEGVLHVVGARYPAAPLGLITVAAMLPADWDVRLINRNTEELTAGRPDMGRHGDDGRHVCSAAGYTGDY